MRNFKKIILFSCILFAPPLYAVLPTPSEQPIKSTSTGVNPGLESPKQTLTLIGAVKRAEEATQALAYAAKCEKKIEESAQKEKLEAAKKNGNIFVGNTEMKNACEVYIVKLTKKENTKDGPKQKNFDVEVKDDGKVTILTPENAGQK